MKRILFSLVLIGLVLVGCAQLGNYGTKESPTAPALPFSSPTASPTPVPSIAACVQEGQSLGAVIPGNTAKCCAGLVAYIPENIVGTRGTCMNPQNVPTPQPSEEPTGSAGMGVANPASGHCVQLGYTEAFQDEGTQCLFTDGTSCDEWKFYRGICGEPFSACARTNGNLTVGSGRLGSAYFQFGLCTFADGSQCGEGELTDGTCTQGQCKSWTAQGCQN